MTRIVAAALALALALPVSAATTWSIDTSQPGDLIRVSKVLETTGTGDAPANPAKATGTFTLNTCVAGETAIVGTQVFTAHATRNDAAYFKVGANDDATAANLAAAILRYSRTLGVSASAALTVVTVTRLEYGASSLALTETGDGITAAGLSGGVDVVGLNLVGLKGYVVQIEASGGNMTAGGKLLAYVLNPVTMKWARAPGLDETVSALAAEVYRGWTVVADWSHVAYVPSGIGRSSTTYLVGRKK